MPPLYVATVPVLRHYLGQVAGIVDRAGAMPEARLGDAFPAGQQFATAAGFALRVTCPLIGRAVPDLPQALLPRLAAARAELAALDPVGFAGAESRIIRHRAGFADLAQSGVDFVHLYGMPNFFFHITMGYAGLRAAGLPLGKADFDGFHAYPPGFSFSD